MATLQGIRKDDAAKHCVTTCATRAPDSSRPRTVTSMTITQSCLTLVYVIEPGQSYRASWLFHNQRITHGGQGGNLPGKNALQPEWGAGQAGRSARGVRGRSGSDRATACGIAEPIRTGRVTVWANRLV